MKIKLEVLPFSLSEPDKSYGIYYRGLLEPGQNESVGEERFIKQLQEIKETGFNALMIYDTGVNYVTREFEIIRDMGFKNPIVQTSPYAGTQSIPKSFGYTTYFYQTDEPSDEKLPSLITLSRDTHMTGKTITAIGIAQSQRLDNPEDPVYADFPAGTYEPLDTLILALWRWNAGDYSFHDYVEDTRKGTAVNKFPDRPEFYYWQMWLEMPEENRFRAGYYLWYSKMDGVFPYVYQHIVVNPFDDFEPDVASGDAMVTYPTEEGDDIPTLQWRALREGIDDMRYLYTLEEAIQKNEGNSEKQDAVFTAKDLLQQLDDKLEELKSKPERANSYFALEEYQEYRRRIAESIVALRSRQ